MSVAAIPSLTDALELALVCGVLPLWAVAGLADAWCHRKLRIEETSGWPETALHLAMLGELGLGVVAVALLRPDAGLLTALLVLCVAHEATLAADLAYASRQRVIPAREQWVHGVQHGLPWTAWLLVALLHHDQALAAIGLGDSPARWNLSWRISPLPSPVLGLIVAIGLLEALTFGAEWWRARRVWRAPRHQGLAVPAGAERPGSASAASGVARRARST